MRFARGTTVRNKLYSALGFAGGLFLLTHRHRENADGGREHADPGRALVEAPRDSAAPAPATPAPVNAGPVELVKHTVKSFMDDDCMTLGAALAYYTVFSLAPLLLTVISIAGLALGRESVQHDIQVQIGSLIGSDAAKQVQTMLSHGTQNRSGGIIGTVIGLIVLLAGATGTFGSLQDALNKVWHVKPDPKAGGIKAFLGKRLLSFGMILGVAFLLLVSLVLSAALGAFGTWAGGFLPAALSGGFLRVLNFAVSFAVITALFAAIFKILPDAKIRWHDVWLGAAVTSLLFTIGKTVIGLYLAKSATASAYGAAGSFVLIVLWLNYASLILLFGAEFTKLWTSAQGERAEPESGAVHVVKEERHQRA
jgi:membrane protein